MILRLRALLTCLFPRCCVYSDGHQVPVKRLYYHVSDALYCSVYVALTRLLNVPKRELSNRSVIIFAPNRFSVLKHIVYLLSDQSKSPEFVVYRAFLLPYLRPIRMHVIIICSKRILLQVFVFADKISQPYYYYLHL